MAALGGLPWSLRPEVVLPLAVLAALYALGWWRLSRRVAGPPSWSRPAAALIGLASLAAALVSPLDALADRRFAAHMIQHMLLVTIAAPALLLADPFPIVLWALPGRARRRVGGWVSRSSPIGRGLAAMTAMAVAWVVYAAVLWGWHVPAAYDAALSARAVHDVEHLTFFCAAILFWWPVIGPAPRLRAPRAYPARIVYLVLAAFQTAALGLALTLAPTVLYRTYAVGVDPAAALDDQTWGGVVMWSVGGLIDMLAVLVLLYRALGSAPGPADASPGTR